PDHIWFADDIIGLRGGWMARFADELEARDARVGFKCQSRVDLLLREGEIDAFRRAGAHNVWVGAESGSQKILDAMDKGTRVEQIYEATERLHDAGIRVGFFLQFGYPGEDRGDIEKTLRMVRECRPDEIGMSVSYPLPGTKFYQMVEQDLGPKQNWIDSEDLDMMFVGTYTTEFYRQLYRVLHKEFRARSAARRLLGALRRPTRLDRGAFRLAGAALYHGATLPLARFRMQRLMRLSDRRAGSLSTAMTPQEAAVPTPESSDRAANRRSCSTTRARCSTRCRWHSWPLDRASISASSRY
ncbi:MAG: radical SAM protein, partial [Acidobacteria bacterium]|nr:radical SAM protein [Acidobacteriota bacterium]